MPMSNDAASTLSVASKCMSILLALYKPPRNMPAVTSRTRLSEICATTKPRSKLQRGFVVAQISLSLVLLVTAGMFLGGLYKASKIDMHFDATDKVLAASFDIGMQGYT